MKELEPPGPLIGTGRYADVYDLGQGRVLRRYRDPAASVEAEAEVMAYARANGVPAPEVFEASGTDIVMEKAAGPTMLGLLARQPWTMARQAKLLAELHRLVHALAPLPGLSEPFGAGGSLLHTDLHPENVIITGQGPRLIDWQGAANGPAEADMALSWVIIATAPVPGPPTQRVVASIGRGLFARLYLDAVAPMEREWLRRAALHRLEDPSLLASEADTLRTLLERGRLSDRRRGS